MEEQTKKIEEEKENKDSLSVKEPSENKQTHKKDSLITWIILGVGLVIILTIIVLIGLKLQKSKNTAVVNNIPVQSETTPQAADKQSQAPKSLTKEELIKQAFYYPNTTSEQADDDFDLVLYTNDPVTTVYKYYEDLIDLNDWHLGPSGMQTGNEAGFLNIYQDDFNADFSVRKVSGEYGSTKIEIRIDHKEEIPLTSTLNRPSSEPSQLASPSDTKMPQTSDQNEYVLPFSNSRKIAREDLAGFTYWQLKVARNEIYARHGRSFAHQDLSCYFDKLSWYRIDPEYGENKLSPLEMSNAVFILNYEKEINSPLINKDTGCR